MKQKEIFQLAVRLLGLAFVYQGLTALPISSQALYGAVLHPQHVIDLIVTMIAAAWPFIIAYWLLRGAPLLLRIAYPENRSNSNRDNNVPELRPAP